MGYSALDEFDLVAVDIAFASTTLMITPVAIRGNKCLPGATSLDPIGNVVNFPYPLPYRALFSLSNH